jgi:hypothetical protein
MAIEDSVTDQSAPPLSIVNTVRGHLSLTRLQGVCGTLAAMLSIGGAFGYLVPAKPDHGEVVAIVQEARTGKPVVGFMVEVLTLNNSLVTTVPPGVGAGSAKTEMKEGTYRLRVVHPKYTTESRQIYVLPGQIAQIHVRLSPKPAPPPIVAAKPASGPFEGIKRLFR